MADTNKGSVADWWAGLALRDSLVLLIGGIAIAWYFCCIYFVGYGVVVTADSPPTTSSLSISQPTFDFMALSITTISGTLATFLGLVLGFGQVQSSRKVSEARLAANDASSEEADSEEAADEETQRSPIDPRMLERSPSYGAVQRSDDDAAPAKPVPVTAETLRVSWIQSVAACAYLASLVWALSMFVQDETGQLAAVLQNLAKSTLGVIGGVLAVVLNVK